MMHNDVTDFVSIGVVVDLEFFFIPARWDDVTDKR